ncbi:MAG: holo-ACP synthase [Clostridia bacterium]|nr:holo-ACP synthase [Clostridia bacterium]
MIYGIGIDITEIERIEKALKTERFLERFFSEEEIKYFKSKKQMAQSVAANFAAKEAFSKAIGTGVRGFSLAEVEILRDDLGKPHISLSGDAKRITDELGISGLLVSISHSEKYAVAQVLAEK